MNGSLFQIAAIVFIAFMILMGFTIFVFGEEDEFGITELYPTVRDGREWFSYWGNNTNRTFGSEVDPYDPQFDTTYGDGSYTVDGNGTLIVSGEYPRMYVYDPNRLQTWHNVEITFYAKRISEFEQIDWAGIQAYGRTAHVDDYDPCTYRGYGGQMLYTGEMKFEKEVNHHVDDGYVDNAIYKPWDEFPKDVWVGYKFVIYNEENDGQVKLELYRDMTDGLNGGQWELMTEYTDDGHWGDDAPPCSEDTEPDEVLAEPALSVYIRNDGITEAQYKKFSVREISSPE